MGEARAKLEVADSEAVLRAKTDVARTNLRAKSGAAQATPQAKTQVANADLLSRSKCGGGRIGTGGYIYAARSCDLGNAYYNLGLEIILQYFRA